jgi:D-3-phosphoglycerate dehydrogenase
MTVRIVVSDSKVIDLDTKYSAFADIDATVRTTDAQDSEALIEDIEDANALIVDAGTQVTADVLTSISSLQVVGRSGIGVDNVDVTTAQELDITVVNVPDYCIDEVSTHAFGMLLSCARRLPRFHAIVKDGEWDWSRARPIYRMAGKTVGIVGFGRIGRSFAQKLRGFELDIIVYDPYISSAESSKYDVTREDFDKLLSESDFVSIHAPLTDETRGLFDATAFELMNENTIIINTARGPIIDEDALIDALATDSIGGVGLDVRNSEPPEDDQLLGFENVIVSPHAAFYSEESRRELTHSVCEDVVRVLQGDRPHNIVNHENEWV